ncbi:hypothetical protein [Persicobacter psychrovividus]|uniref:Outer membrane protein beta-barrel domain-containing protein n=1 Tax=Persicobacter psychrovividus TaxID=387638 RepID=A0ABM7VCF1_9BACT|nr:hypothetical protein PEPS_06920 [Persicobacter psychrovividus]
MLKKLLVIALVVASLGVAGQAVAQENHHEEENSLLNSLNIYTGFTFIPKKHYVEAEGLDNTGNWVPAIGLDYFRKLSERWSVGFTGDVELDQYSVRPENSTEAEEEVRRENVMILGVVGKYEFLKGLSVFAGPGYEHAFAEEDENFFVIKTGLEYEIEFGDGWQITPSVTYDYKDVYQTISYGFSVGKRF